MINFHPRESFNEPDKSQDKMRFSLLQRMQRVDLKRLHLLGKGQSSYSYHMYLPGAT